jgi:hypothetical protein
LDRGLQASGQLGGSLATEGSFLLSTDLMLARILQSRLASLLLLAALLAGSARAHPEVEPIQPTVTRCDPHCYNTNYLFPVTREMRNACLDPIATTALLPLTVVADLLLLPAGVVMGLFG